MTEAAANIPWLSSREAVARVARHLGCTPEDAELQIVGKGQAGLIRARGVVEDRSVSPLPAAWNGTIDLAGTTMRPPGASYEITNVTLCFGDLVAQRLLTTPALGRAWWSAAEALAWIIMGVPLALEEWAGLHELGGWMEQAGKELARMIGEDQVPAQGRKGSPQGPIEQIPDSDLRIPGFTWVVRPHGDLGTSPPGRLAVFLGAPRGPAEPERRCWHGIEVDAAALKRARPRPLTTPADPASSVPKPVKRTGGRPSAAWRTELYHLIDGGQLDPALTNAAIADHLKGKRGASPKRKTILNVLPKDKKFVAWREKK